jgi:hypothetical protein
MQSIGYYAPTLEANAKKGKDKEHKLPKSEVFNPNE